MDSELKDKLQSLKSDGKKSKGCTACKKKKEPVTELPDPIEIDVYIPSPEEIRLAYIELGNKDQNKKELINKVFQFLYDEDFNFGCTSCMNVQVRKLKNYINEVLKLNVL
jgi:hypothetical protein